MIDHRTTSEPDPTTPGIVDYPLLVDEYRSHTTDWIRTERDRVVRNQRALRVRELALTRVLDERGAVDDTLAATDGVTIRSVRDTLTTARLLEDLPTIAAAAAAGRLSDAQLTHVVRVADPSDEHEWAARAPAWSPHDLAHEARIRRTPTIAEADARRANRTLRFWWNEHSGMLDGKFSLPDIDGATFETAVNDLVEHLRPARGQAWESRDRRGADALIELCRSYTERDPNAPTTGYRAHFVVQVPTNGPATVAGIPLPVAMVERLRADAHLEPVLTNGTTPVGVGRTQSTLTEKTKRVIRQRDSHCRYPGCDRRTGLQIHHLWPSSWGGTDNLWNLATICTHHHTQLAPHGTLLLLGNPHDPAGL
ncbi:MAG: DUF222 domain-containing protein, partial [Actinomycetes bacterium]